MDHVIEYKVTDAALAELAERHKNIDAHKDLDAAKAAQKECRQLRKKVDDQKKVLKADALKYTRAVDAEYRRIMGLIADVETPIKDQLDEIRNAERRREEERIAKIERALDEIKAHAIDRHDLDITNLEIRIGNLEVYDVTEDVFQEHLSTAIAYRDDGLSKLKISLRNAKERAEEEARLAKQRKEQEAEAERLQKQREEFEREQREAREKEAARAAEARKAEEDKLRKERKELEERERAQREKEEAEAREKAEREAEERRLRLAPDHQKLEALATAVEEYPLPQLESDEANIIVETFVSDMKRAIARLRLAAKQLK